MTRLVIDRACEAKACVPYVFHVENPERGRLF